MPEVRRRRVAATAKPVSRPRDRAAAVEEDEEDDVDVTRRPARARAAVKPVRRRAAPPKGEDDLEEEEEDEEEEDDEEEAPRPRRAASRTRRAAPVDEDDEGDDDPEEDEEDDDDDDPPPRRRTSAKAAAKPAARRRPAASDDDDDDDEPAPRRRGKLPPGIRAGMAGVTATAKAGGFGADRLVVDETPKLFKILEEEPYASYSQHWVPNQTGTGNRPYTCYGEDDCPLCDAGNRPSPTVETNVLWLRPDGPPVVKTLQIGIKAWNDLISKATDKNTDEVKLQRNYFAVRRTGKNQQSQTSFQPVKLRDIEEDWEELLDHFDIADLPELVKEAKKKRRTIDQVQFTPMKELREVAKYLAED